MRVVVNNSGCHNQAVRLDDAPRFAVYSSDLDDPTAAHRDVAVKARQPGTIDYFSVPNH
jgi:hypothetical protein